MPAARTRVAACLALVSATVISHQIVLMRVLSIAQWHHFAYMVISMAMLGFGAAGTVVALAREWVVRSPLVLPVSLVATGAAVPVSALLYGLTGSFDAFLLFFEPAQVGLLILTYLVSCLPFFFAGLAITAVFTREVGSIGRLYFANLAGSAAGAPLVLVLLAVLPLQVLPGLLALLPLTAALLLRSPAGPGRTVARIGAPAAVILAVASAVAPLPGPSQYKPLNAALLLPEAQVIHRSSGPHGRVEVVSAPAQRASPGLSLAYLEEPPVRDVMFVDGEYFGTLLGFDPLADRHLYDETTRGLPYALRRPGRVLVLEAGTGTDVSHALAHGAASVAAVEPNRQAARLLTRDHPEWIDSLYLDSRVTLSAEGIRGFLSRSADRYDLIALPVLGAFGGTSGVHALREHYHLTMEAFGRMWELLSEEGMIACTVWIDTPPRESLRLLGTWRALLERQGLLSGPGGAERHITAVRSWATTTLVLSRSALRAADREAVRTFASRLSFDPLVLEGLEPGERDRYNRMSDGTLFAGVDAVLSADTAEIVRYPFDVAPVPDDRPYFAHFVRWRSLGELAEVYGTRSLPYLELAFFLAVVTFLQIAGASVLLIVLPLGRIGWRSGGRLWTFLYFGGTGLGFMFFEIVVIQQLLLELGEPVYAAAAALAVLLLASGVGSHVSSRLPSTPAAMVKVAVAAAVLLAGCAALLMPALRSGLGWPPVLRAALILLLLSVPAFLMGMLFPLGLRRLSGSHAAHIPWACGIDSCLSVTATAAATLLALRTGFTVVIGAAAAAYCVTALAAWRLGAGERG